MLFINQYYWPDHASTAQHLADLAESLADRGFECHVLCGRGTYDPGAAPPPASESRGGVAIHRVRATSLGRRSTPRRMADYLSFFAGAAWRALTLPRFDVVCTLTTPPMIGLLGVLLRELRGTTHVIWSMDLHPDASIALGRMSRRHPGVSGLAWLADAILRRADRVVALGPYMADRLRAKEVRPSRLAEVPVWSRRDEIRPVPAAENPLRRSLGLGDRFVLMYSGNLGLAHSSGEFLEAARRLRDRDDLAFLFVGGGPGMADVRRAKEAEGLGNVHVSDYVPREQLNLSLSVADAHLVSMRPEMTGIVVPSKLYGAMASGRPVLFVGPDHCETGDAIRIADCGVGVRPGDADGLTDAILRLAADRPLAAEMGRRGRAAFLDRYERASCCVEWGDLLDELIGGRRVIEPSAACIPVSS